MIAAALSAYSARSSPVKEIVPTSGELRGLSDRRPVHHVVQLVLQSGAEDGNLPGRDARGKLVLLPAVDRRLEDVHAGRARELHLHLAPRDVPEQAVLADVPRAMQTVRNQGEKLLDRLELAVERLAGVLR